MKILVNLNCLGDNSHRSDSRSRYDEYDEMQTDDSPVKPLIDLLQGLSEVYDIIVYTSMRERYRYQVEQWLTDNEVPADEVLMRPDDDYSKNHELWLDMIMGIGSVLVVIESDTRTIEELRGEEIYVLESI